MSSPRVVQVLISLSPWFLTGSAALAQHDFERTKTVDGSGRADETTIQGAIDAIGEPAQRWTVLIYAGTHAEAVTLDDRDENIDLVGIDRDTVIIAPSTGSGIKITSGAETTRNNAIRNLTIKPTSGIGIEIIKGGTPVPKDIILDNVIIAAAGSGKDGVLAEEVENLTITNSTISAAAGHGIELAIPFGGGTAPKNVTITNSTITGAGTGNSGIDALDADGVIITNSTVTSAAAAGIRPGRNTYIRFSTVMGVPKAVAQPPPGERTVIQHSILGDRTITGLILENSPPPPRPDKPVGVAR